MRKMQSPVMPYVVLGLLIASVLGIAFAVGYGLGKLLL
jgi:capsular polysaccharide biosynthesis protein